VQGEKAKIQRFISILPKFMKKKLEFDYPKTMDNVVQKARIYYQQMKQKNEGPKWGLNKKGRSLIPNKHPKFANNRNAQRNTFSKLPARNQPKTAYSENRPIEGATKSVNDQQSKSPLQCWGCGETHYYKNCPHQARTKRLSNMQEASIVGEVARSIPRINTTLDDHQAEFQPIMIECEGMIAKKPSLVLFDPGASLSYVTPKVVEKCQLSSKIFSKP